MTERRIQLAGIGALRRAFATLDALTAPAVGLARADGVVAELSFAGPRELAAAPELLALRRALDELDGAAAPDARAAQRPRRGARVELPASASKQLERDAIAGRRTRMSMPSPSPMPARSDDASDRRRDDTNDVRAGHGAAHTLPVPDGRDALARLAGDAFGAAVARRRVVAPMRTPPSEWPRSARLSPTNASPPAPSPATSLHHASRAQPPSMPTSSNAPTSSRVPSMSSSPSPNAPIRVATPAAAMSTPRGLRGLASWWGDRNESNSASPESASIAFAAALPAAALAPAAPASPASRPAPVLEPSAPAPVQRFAGLDALLPALPAQPGALAARRFAPAMSALDNLDDVTHAIERVLVRELRRHGVTPEEP